MAYAAVSSLKQTINGLLNSSTREILESAYNQTTSLQKTLERFNDGSGRCSEMLNALEGKIRDYANQLEDVLELHELNDSEVRQETSSFAEAVAKIEAEYIDELSKPAIAATVSSYKDFGVEMVGHSCEIDCIRGFLLHRMRPDDMFFFSVQGEVGCGRTSAAKAFFDDQRKGEEEQLFAWVPIGDSYSIEENLIRILAQLDNLGGYYEEMLHRDKICSYLNKILKSQRCLVVLDDVRDEGLIHYLRSSCPDQSNGSLIVFTTSSESVSQLADMKYEFNVPKSYYQDAMWYMITEVVFRGESMPPELTEYGNKIVENCQASEISSAKTLLFLHKTEKTTEQWSMIAADKDNSIFMVGDEIIELLEIKRQLQSMDETKDELIVRVISRYVDYYPRGNRIRTMLQPERYFCKMQTFSLLGMAGIGKTTFARIFFRDKSIMSHFDHLVWITLGPNYQPEEILIDILAQIYPEMDKMLMKRDDKLVRDLCEQLARKRCLIVLDDLWSKEPLSRLKYLFPDIKGTALVTTRLAKVTKLGVDDLCCEVGLLDKEESWILLCKKVFAQGSCPPELEKAGRKIVEKCEGLPLLILTVAEQLLKVEMSVEYWNRVASGKQKSVFTNAHREISKALLPSYERLPQHLKACFLYMGVFCNDYQIPTFKLTDLWIIERFLEPNLSLTVEGTVAKYLSDLVDDSLVMAECKVLDFQFSICRLHPVFWHLSNSVAVMNKLFYAMDSYEDCSIEIMKGQRRLCIRNNVLLGIKDVHDAMKSCSKSCSLLCVGPPLQYPVSLCFGSRLLRVLDAVAIRFYEFPVEVVELIHLRYLSLTCYGVLPTSISKLWKLQHLIVNRYINTRSSENCSPLPIEIWDMKELKHLQVMGGVLPNPKCGNGLPNLSTLLDVSAQSCTKKVLKRIPNLKRLGVQIELAPDGEGTINPFRFLNRISRLRTLESLKCVVMNPHIGSNVVRPPAPVSMFPSGLKELSLSGFGYPWEYMSTISKLKKLQVLKLKCYAFRGAKWAGSMDYSGAFTQLKFLLVEDTDLVQWEAKLTDFNKLERLSIKHCYKIQELPNFSSFHGFKKVEIVDCSLLTVSWFQRVSVLIPHICEDKLHLSWLHHKGDLID